MRTKAIDGGEGGGRAGCSYEDWIDRQDRLNVYTCNGEHACPEKYLGQACYEGCANIQIFMWYADLHEMTRKA